MGSSSTSTGGSRWARHHRRRVLHRPRPRRQKATAGQQLALELGLSPRARHPELGTATAPAREPSPCGSPRRPASASAAPELQVLASSRLLDPRSPPRCPPRTPRRRSRVGSSFTVPSETGFQVRVHPHEHSGRGPRAPGPPRVKCCTSMENSATVRTRPLRCELRVTALEPVTRVPLRVQQQPDPRGRRPAIHELPLGRRHQGSRAPLAGVGGACWASATRPRLQIPRHHRHPGAGCEGASDAPTGSTDGEIRGLRHQPAASRPRRGEAGLASGSHSVRLWSEDRGRPVHSAQRERRGPRGQRRPPVLRDGAPRATWGTP